MTNEEISREFDVVNLENAIDIVTVTLNITNSQDYKEQLDVRKRAYQLLLKALQIKPRTIDNLREGDYIELETMDNIVEDFGYPKTLKGVVHHIGRDYFEVATWEFGRDDIANIKITPKEWIELWEDK